VEYLARLGGYGTVVATLQCAILERADISHAIHTISAAAKTGEDGVEMISLAFGYVASLTSFYILVSWLLQNGSSATVMNLSLLTADFWSVLVGVMLLCEHIGYLYAVAFAAVIAGLVLYHWEQGLPGCPDSLAEPLVLDIRSEQHADIASGAAAPHQGPFGGVRWSFGSVSRALSRWLATYLGYASDPAAAFAPTASQSVVWPTTDFPLAGAAYGPGEGVHGAQRPAAMADGGVASVAMVSNSCNSAAPATDPKTVGLPGRAVCERCGDSYTAPAPAFGPATS